MSFDPVTAAFDLGGKLLDKFFPNPAEKAEAMFKLEQMKQTGELAQLAAETDLAKGQQAINQVEAASSSLFVAGARPFIMWVCGVAFAYHFIIQPLLAFIIANTTTHVVVLPVFDMDTLSTVLMGMLGLGGLRSLDKIKGVA
ncbi:Holin of 3TMs, for gene-transfer release [uncultured Caudovirales phage]|uniref:Holin of 3TMs, for gene-transfer release n=1 Tax=uncultured Caudovirales phage TaxID=2100421 RepID=A0A6J7WJJ6_9CAUD|nr:Holin of 3TMs, for gene-transfer release [uncultured Caudovirales phage]